MLRTTAHHPHITSDEVCVGMWRKRIPANGKIVLIFGRAADVEIVSTKFCQAQDVVRNFRHQGWSLDRALVVTTAGNFSAMTQVDPRPVYKFPVLVG